jgi:hypothetical protein
MLCKIWRDATKFTTIMLRKIWRAICCGKEDGGSLWSFIICRYTSSRHLTFFAINGIYLSLITSHHITSQHNFPLLYATLTQLVNSNHAEDLHRL